MVLPRLQPRRESDIDDLGKGIPAERRAVLDTLTLEELLYIREKYERRLNNIASRLGFGDITGTDTKQERGIWALLEVIAKRFGQGAIEGILAHFEKKKPDQNKDLGDTMYG